MCVDDRRFLYVRLLNGGVLDMRRPDGSVLDLKRTYRSALQLSVPTELIASLLPPMLPAGI